MELEKYCAGMKKYLWIINVLFVVGLTYSVAKAVNRKVEEKLIPPRELEAPPASAPFTVQKNFRSLTQYSVVYERNLFDSKNALRDLLAQQQAKPLDEGLAEGGDDGLPRVPLAKLNAKLIGTMLMGGMSQAFFLVGADRVVLGIGEYLEDAVIIAIEIDRVFVRRASGKEEQLMLALDDNPNAPPEPAAAFTPGEEEPAVDPAASGIKPVDGNKFIISRERVDATLADLNKVLTQARAIPFTDPATKASAGFKIVAIKPNSIYRELGIRNGDVIQRINGNELNTFEAALGMFQAIKTESNFSIDFLRRGVKKSHSYEIQ